MQMTIDPAQKSSQPSSAPEIPYQFADPCPVKIKKKIGIFFSKKNNFHFYENLGFNARSQYRRFERCGHQLENVDFGQTKNKS